MLGCFLWRVLGQNRGPKRRLIGRYFSAGGKAIFLKLEMLALEGLCKAFLCLEGLGGRKRGNWLPRGKCCTIAFGQAAKAGER